jgi:hypothetical protein
MFLNFDAKHVLASKTQQLMVELQRLGSEFLAQELNQTHELNVQQSNQFPVTAHGLYGVSNFNLACDHWP